MLGSSGDSAAGTICDLGISLGSLIAFDTGCACGSLYLYSPDPSNRSR